MKRILPVVVAALLALATARVPAATAAASPLSTQQTEELVGSYVRLTADFYKKVDRQAVLDGARTSMIEYLKKHNVANASLPQLHATADDESNAEALHREVSTAVNEYASKLTPVESISPSSQITYAAIAGVLSSVKDRYTTFLTPKEYAALNEGLDGASFGGVGISYSPDEKTQTLHIENVIPDGPSEKAGLQPEDAITAVDGKSVAELLAPTMTEKDEQKRLGAQQKVISGVLRGNPGTRVRLTVQRNGKLLEPVTITRETIHSPSVTAKMLPGQIGYVDLSVFGQTTAAELTAALKRLDSQGAKAYVLDLRSNGGGYLNAAIEAQAGGGRARRQREVSKACACGEVVGARAVDLRVLEDQGERAAAEGDDVGGSLACWPSAPATDGRPATTVLDAAGLDEGDGTGQAEADRLRWSSGPWCRRRSPVPGLGDVDGAAGGDAQLAGVGQAAGDHGQPRARRQPRRHAARPSTAPAARAPAIRRARRPPGGPGRWGLEAEMAVVPVVPAGSGPAGGGRAEHRPRLGVGGAGTSRSSVLHVGHAPLWAMPAGERGRGRRGGRRRRRLADVGHGGARAGRAGDGGSAADQRAGHGESRDDRSHLSHLKSPPCRRGGRLRVVRSRSPRAPRPRDGSGPGR